jgi:hypothetical protein
VAGAGLRIVCMVEPLRYDPDTWLTDPKLRARTAALAPMARAALAEAVCGNMGIHIAYCVRASDPVAPADWDAPGAVPVLREIEGSALARALRPDGLLPVTWDGLRAAVPVPRLAGAILSRIDGVRSWGDIVDDVVAGGAPREATERDRAALGRAMERLNRLLLAAPA